MNSAERKVLRSAIRLVAHHNSNAWWELKRQIWEGGYQSFYPMESDFRHYAEMAILQLPSSQRDELRSILDGRSAGQSPLNDQDLCNEYVPLILEEIVRRAGIAAYRTVNW